ncbi:MAG: hypothetical protein AABY87_04745 [bacterium]
MSNLTDLLQVLGEVKTKNVSNTFEQFLDKEINISKGIRSLASVSQNHIRDFLASECKRDFTFPRVLSIADSDFLGGSFARHAKIWPLDDIDIYLPLDGLDLFYIQNGLRLPYTVISDNVLKTNPLLNRRWMNGSLISSVKLINEFAAVLRRHYPKETGVRSNGEAISVRMSQCATKTGDGLGYDVVPCFLLKPFNAGELPFYLMPDGNDGWLRTNPKIDAEISDQLHADNNKTFRKVVKLIKYWNAKSLGGTLNSYYIELAVARVFLEKNKIGENIRSISFGVALGFWALDRAVQQGNQIAWISNAPHAEPGQLNSLNRILLSMAVSNARSAWDLERQGNEGGAIQAWAKVFGDAFLSS